MSAVVVDISVSLDGYVTGPNAGPGNGLGDRGEALHRWVFEGTDADRAVLNQSFERSGAVIQGRRLFDVIDAPDGWNEEMGYGATRDSERRPPVFVVTHEPPATTRLGDRFTFVTGLTDAIDRAREAAGDKDVVVMGGGEICHAVLAAGLADVLLLHVAPVVLGDGTRLYPASPGPRVDLELTSAVSTPHAQHLTYAVRRN